MNYIITNRIPHFEKIGEYSYTTLQKLLTLPDEVSFDSETTGLSPVFYDMFCIQIGDRTNNYIVDFE